MRLLDIPDEIGAAWRLARSWLEARNAGSLNWPCSRGDSVGVLRR